MPDWHHWAVWKIQDGHRSGCRNRAYFKSGLYLCSCCFICCEVFSKLLLTILFLLWSNVRFLSNSRWPPKWGLFSFYLRNVLYIVLTLILPDDMLLLNTPNDKVLTWLSVLTHSKWPQKWGLFLKWSVFM